MPLAVHAGVTRDLVLLLRLISNMLRVRRLQEHSAYMYRAVVASAVLATRACGLAGATAVAVVDEGEDSRLHCVGLFVTLRSWDIKRYCEKMMNLLLSGCEMDFIDTIFNRLYMLFCATCAADPTATNPRSPATIYSTRIWIHHIAVLTSR